MLSNTFYSKLVTPEGGDGCLKLPMVLATWQKSIEQVLGDLRPYLGKEDDALETWTGCADVAAYIRGGTEEIRTISMDIRTWKSASSPRRNTRRPSSTLQ